MVEHPTRNASDKPSRVRTSEQGRKPPFHFVKA
jgi:hypothetical protein